MDWKHTTEAAKRAEREISEFARKGMQRQDGDWKRYREQFALTPADQVDLHFGRRNPDQDYWEVMADLEKLVERRLREAQKNGRPYVMFIHGSSTSGLGRTTARSVVRKFMRSPAATSLIERSGCIQHRTVFVAKVRPATPRCG